MQCVELKMSCSVASIPRPLSFVTYCLVLREELLVKNVRPMPSASIDFCAASNALSSVAAFNASRAESTSAVAASMEQLVAAARQPA